MSFALADSDIPIHILIFNVLSMIPAYHYILAFSIFVLIFLYNFLEFHVFGDFLRGLKGDRVVLTYNLSSKIYEDVASKCRILHGSHRCLCCQNLYSKMLAKTMPTKWFHTAPKKGYATPIINKVKKSI